MNVIPSLSTVNVPAGTGPAEWWQILAALGPLVVLLGVIPLAYVLWRLLWQRATADRNMLEQRLETDAKTFAQVSLADRREQWWRRTHWALDLPLDDDEDTKALGLATLDVLALSELAGKEELELLDTTDGRRRGGERPQSRH